MGLQFEEIYNQYKDLVYNLALSYVQNIEDAQEITQDVFVSIYKSLGSFRFSSKVSTWVYRITINKSLDFIKAKKRKKRLAVIIAPFLDEDARKNLFAIDFNHPGIILEDKESLERIFKKINELNDQQRTALILHKIENKSQAEVAEIMDMNIKAVESLIQRAKKNLYNKLNQSEG